MLRIVIAALHLLALGLGLGAVIARGAALKERPATPGALARALQAQVFWSAALLLWIVTGLWRLLGPLEKGAAYYMHNPLFHAKLTAIVAIVALEIWPMLTLLRFHRSAMSGAAPENAISPAAARRLFIFSHLQAALVVIIVFLAVAFARGYGAKAGL